MPKVTKPLTNTKINNARGKAKEYNLADGLGLALRVRPGGDKYWIFNYQRPITKVRANISLGIYPTVSLSSARVIRSEYRDLLAQGIDLNIIEKTIWLRSKLQQRTHLREWQQTGCV